MFYNSYEHPKSVRKHRARQHLLGLIRSHVLPAVVFFFPPKSVQINIYRTGSAGTMTSGKEYIISQRAKRIKTNRY